MRRLRNRPKGRDPIVYRHPGGGDKPPGLLLCFHGSGGSPQLMDKNTDLKGIGQTIYCSVAFLSARTTRDWVHRRVHPNPDIAYVFGFLAEMQHELQYDAERINLAGFSDGASFTHLLLANFGQRFESGVIYAGQMAATKDWDMVGRRPKVIGVTNLDDRIVRSWKVSDLVSAYKAEGCPAHLIEVSEGRHSWNKQANTLICRYLGW